MTLAEKENEWNEENTELSKLDFQLKTSMDYDQVMQLRELLKVQKAFMKEYGEMDEKKMAETIGQFRNLTKEGLDRTIEKEFRLNKFVEDIRHP